MAASSDEFVELSEGSRKRIRYDPMTVSTCCTGADFTGSRGPESGKSCLTLSVAEKLARGSIGRLRRLGVGAADVICRLKSIGIGRAEIAKLR